MCTVHVYQFLTYYLCTVLRFYEYFKQNYERKYPIFHIQSKKLKKNKKIATRPMWADICMHSPYLWTQSLIPIHIIDLNNLFLVFRDKSTNDNCYCSGSNLISHHHRIIFTLCSGTYTQYTDQFAGTYDCTMRHLSGCCNGRSHIRLDTKSHHIL